jgi:two-component system, chemotaxis family, response regulator Rcp1
MEKTERIKILLVDDDQADIELTEELLKESKVKLDLFTVQDGVYAMEFLRKQGEFSEVPTPDLILLDLNMPRKDGRETLEEIKQDPALRQIPVVILTTSDSSMDVAKSYATGANCYIKKPVDLGEFQKVVAAIDDFWFTVVKLPTG